MQKKWKIGIMATAGVLALSTGIGIAAAKTSGNSIQAGFYASNPHDGQFADETVNQFYCGGGSYMGGYLTPQVANLLGMTTTDLEDQLRSGSTLAEIAAAHNVSNDTLIQTMMGPYADHLAIMVKYSFLSQAEADQLAQEAQTRMQEVITNQFNLSNGFLGLGGMMRGWFGGNNPQANGDTTTDPDGDGYGCGGYGPGYGGMMGYGPGTAENGNGSYGYGGMMGNGQYGNGTAGYGGMMGRW